MSRSAPPSNTAFIDSPNAALEAEITTLWGHISAATYRFLKLVGEFDEKEAWRYHGCYNCAHWLNWRCGIGIGAVREKVRVARALQDLPLISAAFAAGQISYSKARALTRIVIPENETALLNIALHGTAEHAEKLIRLYRRTERMQDAEAAFGEQQARYLDYNFDGSALVIRARLPLEVGALFRKAIEAAEGALFAEMQRDSERVPAGTPANAQHDGGVPAGTPYAKAEHACDPAGARRADALCRLVEHFLSHPPRGDERSPTAERYIVNVHIDHSLLAEGSAGPAADGPAHCEIDQARELAAETAKRLGCDGALVGFVDDAAGEPLSVGRKTRSIPPAIGRALAARDGGCRFPGCTRTRFTEGHHVKHWADGGETKLSNLVTLCRFHHRLVHEGGFGLERTDDGLFLFRRRDGTRIEASGCEKTNAAPTLEHINAEHGLSIDAGTCCTGWSGERMDYAMAIEYLIYTRDEVRRVAHGTAPGAAH